MARSAGNARRRPPRPAEAGIADDEIVLLSVGRLEENKGFHVLAARSARCAITAPVIAAGRWRWVLVGDGPYRGRLTRRDSRLGLLGDTPDRAPRRSDAARVVRGGRTLRPSDAVRGQLAGHARSHGASPRGRRDQRRRPARQGRTGRSGWLVPPGDASALAAAISGALAPGVDLPRWALAAGPSSSAIFPGMPRRPRRFDSIGRCSRTVRDRELNGSAVRYPRRRAFSL